MVKQDCFVLELTAIYKCLVSEDLASKNIVNPSWGNISQIFGHLVLKQKNVKQELSVYVYCVP
jgi:hypothetical protein